MTFDVDFNSNNQSLNVEFNTFQAVKMTQIPRVVNISLLAEAWVGETSPYSQTIEVLNATEYSKVDLQPSVEQLEVFHEKDLTFLTENDEGVITVYAVGDKPKNDYTVQATVMEVEIWK